MDANPRPSTIQWFKEGDERFVQNGPTLRLNNVTAAHNGRYICSATNHLHSSAKGKLTRTGNATTDLNIRHKPGKGFILPEHPKAIDGRRITLTCGAKPPGYPRPTYTWWKDDNHDSTLAVGHEFTIDSARLNNAGKYHCQPTNELGKGSAASIDLEVNQAPKIITHLKSTIMKRVGDTGFQITCSAIGKPKPKVRWFKDGQEILDAESNSYQITTTDQEATQEAFNVVSTLKFIGPERIANKQLAPSDRGQYTCRFENEVDAAESSMLFRIEHAPVVAHLHNKVAFDLDETAFISCKMQAYPKPRFDWQFGNTIIQRNRDLYEAKEAYLDKDIYEGTLRINKVTKQSYGDYTCKGINPMGAKRTIIKLQPKGKPERPLNVRVINVGYNFITIGFEPGFNGGYNDTTHSLEYRRYDSDIPGYEECGTRAYCNVTGLEQHSRYNIKVKAQNIKGESKYTQEISADTKIDVAKIPQPEDVHFETTSNTASFSVNNNDMPLVAKVELQNPDGSWVHYDQVSIDAGSYSLGEMPIEAQIVNNLRIRLCLETDDILCGPYSKAKFVDVRPVTQQNALNWQIPLIVVFICLSLLVGCCLVIKCCCRNKINSGHASKKEARDRPSIVHTTHQPPPYHHGIENKGVDTLKDADEMIKNNFGVAFEPQSASNSNSANGGSVNSQDSLWNVKGVPPHHQHDPNMMHMMQHNAYQLQAQGYTVYDAMAMQQQQQQQLQQQHHQQQQQHQQHQQQQHQLQQQYPEDYTHYPHPEEYLNERNQHFVSNGEFFTPGQHESECKTFIIINLIFWRETIFRMKFLQKVAMAACLGTLLQCPFQKNQQLQCE